MTTSEMPNRLYIPQPFASGSDTIQAALTPIQAEPNLNNPNFVEGFPSPYSSPASTGGRYITRGEINAIGNLASVNEYARACGQITTFDPNLAVKIGGYARGAVLEMVSGVNYFKVISLRDDNKVDFNADELTDAQKANGITLGGIDGIYWAYVNQGIVADKQTLFALDDVAWTPGNTENAGVEVVPLGTFVPVFDGFISFEGKLDITAPFNTKYEKTVTTQTGQSAIDTTKTVTTDSAEGAGVSTTSQPCGMMIVCSDNTTQNPRDTMFNVIYSKGNPTIKAKEGGVTYDSSTMRSMYVYRGVPYSFYMLSEYASIENSTLKVTVTPHVTEEES